MKQNLGNAKVLFNGIEMDAHDVQIEIEHAADKAPIAHVADIVNRGMELEANVKLTRHGRRFMQMIRYASTPAAQAGYMLVHKGRGIYKLQPYPYGKRGNKRNIYPYNRQK
jgi:hypothetical protein